MVGFNNVITFNNNGKVTDYQKSYSQEYAKILNVFLPLNFNNKKDYKIVLSGALTNTYPKKILTVEGEKDLNDLNKYKFDLTTLFENLGNKRIGLCQVTLLTDNGRPKFKSETFKLT